MKKLCISIGILLIVSFILIGCNYNSSDSQIREKQEVMMKEADAQAGMPAITRFQERKIMKMILEMRDQENLICYAYLFSEMTGKITFIGKCIGFPIPYATQYTSPQKIMPSSNYTVLPQADPNGLFMPASAEGSWLLLIDPTTGKPKPVYFEPRIIVSPFSLQ